MVSATLLTLRSSLSVATLIVEAALVATYVGGTNTSALLACVAMFFVFQVFYALCLDGTQFSYLGEVFPTHIRAKGQEPDPRQPATGC